MLIAGAAGVYDGAGALLAHEPGLLGLAAHPTLPLVYGVSDAVLTWRLGDGLEPVSRTPLNGTEGCHLACGADALHVAAYGSGSVHRFALADGIPTAETVLELRGSGPDPERQDAAHPHHVLPEGDAVLVADLGSDALIELDAVTLAERRRIALPPGSGPRHSLRVDSRTVAVTGELDASVMLVRDGIMVAHRSVPRASDVRAYPSDLAIADGALVVAVRGSGILARFNPATLEPLGADASDGPWPQALAVENGVLWCANRDSDSATVYGPAPRIIPIPRPTALIRTGTA